MFIFKEKKITLEVCNKGFSRNFHLSSHVIIHTEAKSFACDVCKKGFSQKEHLSKHFRVYPDKKTSEVTTKGFV